MADKTDKAGKAVSGLAVRVLSGVVLAPLAVALIVAGGWIFLGWIMLAALMSLYEWMKMAEATGSRRYWILLIGVFYIAVSYSSYISLRFGFEQGAWLAICAMLCVWASDIGAYFTGKTIGGPKLAPALSPKKTWAGLGGSMFFCGLSLVVLAAAGQYFQAWINTDVSIGVAHAIPLFFTGCFLGIVGQAGDLSVSYFKRMAKIKDTGQLIPGHGGLLDRIDSLMLVSPVFLAAVTIWLL